MKGDRLGSLMVKAAACGAVDFSKARPDDRLWWLRLSWICDELEATTLAGVMDQRKAVILGRVQSLTDADDVQKAVKLANRCVDEASSLLLPYMDDARAEYTRKARRTLADAWRERWGDERTNAKTKAAIDRVIADMRRRRQGRSSNTRKGR